MRKSLGLFHLAASLCVVAAAAPAMTAAQGLLPVTVAAQSKKLQRGVRRFKHAESEGRWPRSRGKPPKRKLHRNLVTHSRRVRRKHRRAA